MWARSILLYRIAVKNDCNNVWKMGARKRCLKSSSTLAPLDWTLSGLIPMQNGALGLWAPSCPL